MAISTNGTVLTRLAGALYNTQMSNATYKEVAALDPSALANVLYARDFNTVSDATVASTLVTNLGLTSVSGLSDWIAAQLTSAGSAKGAKIVELLNGFAQMSSDATYGAAATAFNTKVDSALAMSQTTDNTGSTFDAISTTVNGKTFTLTAGVDAVTGTAGNDTITADNTGSTKQLTVADVINGGAGTDTLRIFLASADTVTSQPTLTVIENVYINGGAMTAYTAAAGTTSLSIDGASANVAATYTLSGQDLTLANKTSTAATITTVAASATSTHTAQKITLNAITRDAAANATTIAVTGSKVTTLNLETTGASNITLTNSDAALTTLNLTGSAAITLADTLTGLKTYNATGTTGAVTLDVSVKTPSTTFSYTGSDARDILTFGPTAAGPKSTMTINGGAGTTDKLVIKDVETTSNTAGINKAVGFEYLGLGSGTANSTYDMSLITSMSIVNIDTSTGATPATAATAASGTAGTAGTAGIILAGLSNANSVIIDAAITSAGGTAGANSTSAITGAAGGAGAVGLTLNPLVDTGSNAVTITLNGITIDSSGGVGGATATGTTSATTGGAGGAGAVSISATSYESVALVSNFASNGTTSNVLKATGGAGAAGASALTGAAGADAAGLALGTNGTLTITGAAALNAGLVSGTNVTINASGLSGNLTMSTGTGNDVITGGSGVNVITLTGGVDTVNLAASTAKADTVAFTSGTGTTSTSFVKIAGFTNAVTTGDKLDTVRATVVIQADVAPGTATGVANLTAQVSSGILSFAGSAAATATLANKVTAATAAAFAGAVDEVIAFEHAGNTYVFAQVGTADAFNNGTDQLIELTGVVGVTALSTTVSGATTLFIA